MEPWAYLAGVAIVTLADGVVRLIAFHKECRLRQEVERYDREISDDVWLTGNASDIEAASRARARTIRARGPLPQFQGSVLRRPQSLAKGINPSLRRRSSPRRPPQPFDP